MTEDERIGCHHQLSRGSDPDAPPGIVGHAEKIRGCLGYKFFKELFEICIVCNVFVSFALLKWLAP